MPSGAHCGRVLHPEVLAVRQVARDASAPSKLTWRGARPWSATCRRTSGTVHVLSAGLPFGIAQSRISPGRPVVR
jgi:hypothetical protein